jgi:DNA repair exonuclease SbcCD ATPase subunit
MNRFLIYGCLLNLLAFEGSCADESSLDRYNKHHKTKVRDTSYEYIVSNNINKNDPTFNDTKKAILEANSLINNYLDVNCLDKSSHWKNGPYLISIESKDLYSILSLVNLFLKDYNNGKRNCSFEKISSSSNKEGFSVFTCDLSFDGYDILKIYNFVKSKVDNLSLFKKELIDSSDKQMFQKLNEEILEEQERLKILLEKEKTKSDKNYSLYLSVKNEKESLQVSYDSKQNTFQNLVESEKKLKKQLGEKESCIKLKEEELNKKTVFLNQIEKQLNKEKENYDGLLNLYNKEKANCEILEKDKLSLLQNLKAKEENIIDLQKVIGLKDSKLEDKENLLKQQESELDKLRSENRKSTNFLNEKIADLTENLSIKEKEILNLKEEKQRLTLKIDQQYKQMNAGVNQINKVIENNEKTALDAYQKKIEKYEEMIEGGKKVFEKEISLLKQEVAEKTKQLDLLRAEKFNMELNFVSKESYNDLNKKYSDLLDEFNKKDFPKDGIVLIKKPSEDKGFDLSVLEDKESLSTIYRAMKKCGYKKERPKDVLVALKELQEHFEEQDGI